MIIPRTTRRRIKQGSTSPPLRAYLMDDEVPVDLTTAAQVRVLGRRGSALVIDGVAVVDPDERGKVEYAWAAEDTAVVGDIQVEFRVTWSDATVSTFPTEGYVVVTVTDSVL